MRGLDDPRGHRSEELAFRAERADSAGMRDEARRLYAEAAALEERVVADTDPAEPRVKGVLGVSAVALWYRANRASRAQTLARHYLAVLPQLDDEYARQFHDLIRRAHAERDSRSAAEVTERSDAAQRYCEVLGEIEWQRATEEAPTRSARVAELERLWDRLDDDDRSAIEHALESFETAETTGEFSYSDVPSDAVEIQGPRVERAAR